MGGTNLHTNLVERLSTLRGEREDVHAMIVDIRNRWSLLSGLEAKLKKLDAVIDNVEDIIRYDYPDFALTSVRPRRRGCQRSPVPKGEMGPTALAILREATEPMTARDIACALLRRFRITNVDRRTLDKVTNSVNSYLVKYRGDLVDADKRFGRKWHVIR